MQYSLTLIDSVPAISTAYGKYLLIDTGSPSSFSETGEIEIAKVQYPVPTILYGKVTAAYLQNAMHHSNITGLVGMDIISKSFYEFDYTNLVLNIISLDNEFDSNGSEQIDLSYAGGVPILPLYLGSTSLVQKFIIVRRFAN